MKILVVVDSINIEDSSGSKANVAFIHNLQYAGFEVLVYHYTRKDIRLQNIITHNIPEIKFSLYYFLSRFQRVISRNWKVNFNPFFEKIFGFSFTFFNDSHSMEKAIRKETFKPDLILTLSKGASFRPHHALLKLPHLHHKWMAYVHDPFPFHYYPRPYNWIEPGYDKKETFFREVSEKAKFSAFPSLLLKEWMSSYFSNFEKTGIIIPHQNSKYEIQNVNFPSYFNPSKFNLLHAGNLMKERCPKGLVKGFELFLAKNPDARKNARLILLGNAFDHTKILEDHQIKIPELFVHNGNIPFDEVFLVQKNASVNIILESKSEISPFLPAKFPHCVAANKIILSLSPFYSEVKRLLGENYEFWCEIDNEEKIASLIEKLYQLWTVNGVDLFLNRKDLEHYVSLEYLKEIVNSLNDSNS